MPAIFSLKCNELPTIFPPHFLLRHSNGASRISRRRRRRRLALHCAFSTSCLSMYHERGLFFFLFFPAHLHQHQPGPLAYRVWEPATALACQRERGKASVSHFLCRLFRGADRISVLTGWGVGGCTRAIKLSRLASASNEQCAGRFPPCLTAVHQLSGWGGRRLG